MFVNIVLTVNIDLISLEFTVFWLNIFLPFSIRFHRVFLQQSKFFSLVFFLLSVVFTDHRSLCWLLSHKPKRDQVILLNLLWTEHFSSVLVLCWNQSNGLIWNSRDWFLNDTNHWAEISLEGTALSIFYKRIIEIRFSDPFAVPKFDL